MHQQHLIWQLWHCLQGLPMALLLCAQGSEEDMQYINLSDYGAFQVATALRGTEHSARSLLAKKKCFLTPQAEDCRHKRQLKCKLTM